jgi:hypothetical protein
MNYNIAIVDEAKIDFRASLIWYKNINPKLSEKFYISFQQSVAIIKKDPLLFQIRYDNIRIKIMTPFPYLIHYIVNNNAIVIQAIYHCSRNSELNIFK